MRRILYLFFLFLLVFISLTAVKLAQAAVTLTSFEPIADLPNHRIRVLWETASELDFAGFYVQRSLSKESNFERLNDLIIPAQGESTGAVYSYDDLTIAEGVLYYYRLEMIDLDGYSEYSVVKSAFLGNTPTPTATNTVTVTQTPVQLTPTRTSTPQPTPTRTRTPSPFHAVTFTSRPRATSTLTDTPTTTPTPTVSPTVTTTLAPLPSLILLFPARTSTPTFTPSPTETPSPVRPSSTPTPKTENNIPLRISFLWGIIILLWLTLAGFLIAYLRRMPH